MGSDQRKTWIDWLDDEDVAFIKRFVLASGSLKELAAAYQVSYPTLRLRLDRLIQKIRVWDEHVTEDEFERLLRAQYAAGAMEPEAFKRLLKAYQAGKGTRP
jgi:hypothetical protein